jgi:hypothetical protein
MHVQRSELPAETLVLLTVDVLIPENQNAVLEKSAMYFRPLLRAGRREIRPEDLGTQLRSQGLDPKALVSILRVFCVSFCLLLGHLLHWGAVPACARMGGSV